MLELKNIVKDYVTGDTSVRALKGIDVTFRRSEFVSVLGPSGCGKTTLLNIVGGLDSYTNGDLIINGRSSKHTTGTLIAITASVSYSRITISYRTLRCSATWNSRLLSAAKASLRAEREPPPLLKKSDFPSR